MKDVWMAVVLFAAMALFVIAMGGRPERVSAPGGADYDAVRHAEESRP